MSTHTYDVRDIPVLTEAVDLAGLQPLVPPTPAADTEIHAVRVVAPPDAAALQAAIVTDTLELAQTLTSEAAREIETLLYERVFEQLRAQLPALVERIVREHLPPDEEQPGDPNG